MRHFSLVILGLCAITWATGCCSSCGSSCNRCSRMSGWMNGGSCGYQDGGCGGCGACGAQSGCCGQDGGQMMMSPGGGGGGCANGNCNSGVTMNDGGPPGNGWTAQMPTMSAPEVVNNAQPTAIQPVPMPPK